MLRQVLKRVADPYEDMVDRLDSFHALQGLSGYNPAFVKRIVRQRDHILSNLLVDKYLGTSHGHLVDAARIDALEKEIRLQFIMDVLGFFFKHSRAPTMAFAKSQLSALTMVRNDARAMRVRNAEFSTLMTEVLQSHAYKSVRGMR